MNIREATRSQYRDSFGSHPHSLLVAPVRKEGEGDALLEERDSGGVRSLVFVDKRNPTPQDRTQKTDKHGINTCVGCFSASSREVFGAEKTISCRKEACALVNWRLFWPVGIIHA